MGGPTTNIIGLYERDRVQGRGERAQEVVASDSCVTANEDYTKRYFGSSVGAAATGIWQAW